MDHFLNTFFRFDFLPGAWPVILGGIWVTLRMAALTLMIGLPMGLLLAILRLYGIRPLNWLLILWIDFFRAVPALVIIVLVYFALPMTGLTLSSFWATVLSMACVLSAVAEEVFWGAFRAVPKGHWEAGRATGLSYNQTLFLIAVPQVLRLSIPPLTNRSIGVTKGVTLGAVVAAPELLAVTSKLQSDLANPSVFTLTAAIYLMIFLPFVQVTRWMERRFAQGVYK
ncbi:L-cystine transport system permease protein TcyB [Aquimixticola soesokkakensis]|uniref:L-cystine transport system permease protein TcyB n=1 Tax=Aquimixticola soesokkakensis TaxID=1519096 RepID=A0A1Y5RXL6_9RHOB|nr:amino acid ABC transporter permease [Aquimixticola soesokkakensis]SLN26506.1 L-cystine transport system permease protein TcyB [Aquimixticola soesokkakensis]